jgi:hypothetical protein
VKDFGHEQDKAVKSWVKTQKFESKKYFVCYRQNSLKVWTKVGFKFFPLCMKESKRNEVKGLFMLKKPFLTQFFASTLAKLTESIRTIFQMTKKVFEFTLNLINTFEFHQALCANISIIEPHLMNLFP